MREAGACVCLSLRVCVCAVCVCAAALLYEVARRVAVFGGERRGGVGKVCTASVRERGPFL